MEFELNGARKKDGVREGYYFNIQSQSQASWETGDDWGFEYCSRRHHCCNVFWAIFL
jgi:hypothetical protein